MKTEEDIEHVLDDLIAEIQFVIQDFKWYLTTEKISEILQTKKEEFQRWIYFCKKNIDYQSSMHGGFNESELEALVRILSRYFGKDDIALRFYKNGIYFSETDLAGFREYFTGYYTEILYKMEIDRELLLLLSSSTLNFDDAYDSYIDGKLSLDLVIRRCADAFCEKEEIDVSSGADAYLVSYIHSLINKKIIRLQLVSREHQDRLYYELYGKVRSSSKPAKKKRSRLEMLFVFFSLPIDCSHEDLGKRYREMLKEYHPDINRDGLEMTKKIIANYKELKKEISNIQ